MSKQKTELELSELDDLEPIEAQVGKRGLRSSVSMQAFLQSKCGQDLITSNILAAENQKTKEEAIFQAYSEAQMAEMVSLGRYKEGEAEKTEQQKLQAELVSAVPSTLPPTPKTNSPPADTSSPPLNSYEDLLAQKTEEIKHAEAVYEEYEKQVKTVDELIDKWESQRPFSKDIKKTDAKISREIDAQLKTLHEAAEKDFADASKFLDKGDDANAHKSLEAAKAKNIQIATLRDYKSVIEGKSNMYDKDGRNTASFKNAAFIVPNDKALGVVGNQILLYDKEHLDEKSAAENFSKNSIKYSRVKDVVHSNKELELGDLNKDLQSIKDSQKPAASALLSAMPDVEEPEPPAYDDEDAPMNKL